MGTSVITRRRALPALAAPALTFASPLRAAPAKPLRGVFVIMATPFTEAKSVDFEDLERETAWLERCGVHGMVWPQLASEYMTLSKQERLQGMEVIARAARGRKPALVFGVQGANAGAAVEFLRHAENLSPDALIAIPPTEAKTLDDFVQYYRTLARATSLPLFVQTTGGAKGIVLEVEALVALAREFPHLGHVKEEHEPVIPRMQALARSRPSIRAVFSGSGGKGMTYEMRLGFDGTMPGAPYADIHAQIWDFYQAGAREKARDLFARFLLMANCEQFVPGTRNYIMKKRGVFKTTVSRRRDFTLTPEEVQEIEFHFEALKPFLRA